MKSILIIDDNAGDGSGLSIHVHHQLTTEEIAKGVKPKDTTGGLMMDMTYDMLADACREIVAREQARQIITEISAGARD